MGFDAYPSVTGKRYRLFFGLEKPLTHISTADSGMSRAQAKTLCMAAQHGVSAFSSALSTLGEGNFIIRMEQAGGNVEALMAILSDHDILYVP